MPILREIKEKRVIPPRWSDAPRPRRDKRKKPKVEFACDECGTVFVVTKTEAEDRKFCSNKCATAANTEPIGLRFNSRWKLSSTGCWEWQGRLNPDGYGTLRYNGGYITAHRLSYELFNGKPVPPGLLICHKCNNRLCCNPEHIYAGTHADNMKDLALANTSSLAKTQWKERWEMARRFLGGEDAEAVATSLGVSSKTVRFWAKRFKEKDRVPEVTDGLFD